MKKEEKEMPKSKWLTFMVSGCPVMVIREDGVEVIYYSNNNFIIRPAR